MTVATLRQLTRLAEAGATVVFEESLPSDVPGLADLESRRAEFKEILQNAVRRTDDIAPSGRIAVGTGTIFVGALENMLVTAGITREPMADRGIRLVRRVHPGGYHYFLVNRRDRPVDGWVTLGVPASSVVIMDPRFDARIGVAASRQREDGRTQIYLQLASGESCILRTFSDQRIDGPTWQYFRPGGAPRPIVGTWQVTFLEGGPVLPANFPTKELASWTQRDDAEAQRFAGTARYTIEFDGPVADSDDWVLALGQVCESARVTLNGHEVGTLWCEPFAVHVGEFLRPGKNELSVEVTDLAANRIRDLDRRGVAWKRFYDINLVNRDYRPFDASDWPLCDSGLLGPVQLQPLQRIDPSDVAGDP